MDWDKTINTVAEVGRKTFTLALATVLVFVAVSGTYIIGLALRVMSPQVAQQAVSTAAGLRQGRRDGE